MAQRRPRADLQAVERHEGTNSVVGIPSIPSSRRRRQPLSLVVGRRIGLLGLAGVGLACGDGSWGGPAERDDSGEVVELGVVSAADVRVGDCLQHFVGQRVVSVEALPCEDPHVYEAYATFQIEQAGEYPATRIEDMVTDACLARWDGMFGTTLDDDPSLSLSYLYPVRAGWDAGDRLVVCFIAPMDEDGYLVGSRVPS